MILTRWENHRTKTEFEDSIIIKLFAFEFVNSYGNLFYLAYFRNNVNSMLLHMCDCLKINVFLYNFKFDYTGGFFNLGNEYQDICESDCLVLVSIQVFFGLLIKPVNRFVTGVLYP